MNRTKKIIRIIAPRRLRNWLRSPSKSLHWAWDDIKYRAGSRTTIQLRPNWSLICHPAAYRCAYFAQDTDPEQVAEFDEFIERARSDMVLFDIGAHFGLFSLAALHYGGQKAIAVAVDPSPSAARFVRIQAELNGISDRLHIVQAAVGDQSGWQDMISVGILASGYFVAPSKEDSVGELTQTKSVTIDQLSKEFGLAPTHIKIDVEGYEASVLRGGVQVLSRHAAPLLFIELHNEIIRNQGGRPQETLHFLRQLGFEIYDMEGRPCNDTEILVKPLIRVIAQKSAN